jgi:hypothetical protein
VVALALLLSIGKPDLGNEIIYLHRVIMEWVSEAVPRQICEGVVLSAAIG